jgi:hypothetical protein
MPKSLFDAELKVADGHLTACGPFEADGDGAPVLIYWLIAQGDIVVRGVTTPADDRWEDPWGDSRHWEDGPATAVALAVTLMPDGVRSFSWSTDVTLKCR